jgi:hypothetical protein
MKGRLACVQERHLNLRHKCWLTHERAAAIAIAVPGVPSSGPVREFEARSRLVMTNAVATPTVLTDIATPEIIDVLAHAPPAFTY